MVSQKEIANLRKTSIHKEPAVAAYTVMPVMVPDAVNSRLLSMMRLVGFTNVMVGTPVKFAN